jgi:flagellar biosynthesis chaperone FliJ
MATFEITFTTEARMSASVEKKLRQVFGKDIPLHTIEKLKTPETRSQRLDEAKDEVDSAKSIVEELKDEMQNWYDSIPENLQGGTKADEVQETIDGLESLQSDLENIDFDSINFPSMF